MTEANPHSTSIAVPREIWGRGRRPWRGTLVRASVALTFVVTGVVLGGWLWIGLLSGLGVLVFLAFPRLVDTRLLAVERQIALADVGEAEGLLSRLEDPIWVALFAPHAWVALQKGRLRLLKGDGRGAAAALSECARLSGASDRPELVGAQAHALVLSGDRSQARELLQELAKRGPLEAASQLDLAIALLEANRHKAALKHLDQAREKLGESPRLLAALAVATHRSGDEQRALEHYDAAVDGGADADPVARELIKRARKGLRSVLDARKSGDRKRGEAKPSRADEGGKRRRKRKRKKSRGKKAGATETADAAPEPEVDEPAPEPEVDEPEVDEPEVDEPEVEPEPKPAPPAIQPAGGDAFVFKPPSLPPPPAVGPKTAAAPRIFEPEAAPQQDEGWGDVLGDGDENGANGTGS